METAINAVHNGHAECFCVSKNPITEYSTKINVTRLPFYYYGVLDRGIITSA